MALAHAGIVRKQHDASCDVENAASASSRSTFGSP